MDTSDGTSERLLVDAAVQRWTAAAPRLLLGGLGWGARCASRSDTRTSPGSTWSRLRRPSSTGTRATRSSWAGRLYAIGGYGSWRPTSSQWLETTPDRHDAICLDIDNGPTG